MISVTVVGMEQVTARFQGAGGRVRDALRVAARRLAIEAQAKVKSEKLTGQMLKSQTGRLRRSINVDSVSSGTTIGTAVGTNLAYGRAWELGLATLFGPGSIGGRTPGRTRSEAAKQRHRAAAPARPFLGSVLAEMRDQARLDLVAAAKGAI